MENDAPNLAAEAPDALHAIEEICTQALQLEPQERYGSAEEMAGAIETYLAVNKTWVKSVEEEEACRETKPLHGNAALNLRQSGPQDAKRQIGDYLIEREIARGGMGTVYLAEDIKLKRQVAIKILLAGPHAWEEERRRFLREGQMAARLSHPNVIDIHYIGTCEEGRFYCNGLFRRSGLGFAAVEPGPGITRRYNALLSHLRKNSRGPGLRPPGRDCPS